MTDSTRLAVSRSLLVSAVILYIPANAIPVMTITLPGQVENLTVLGGVEELYNSGLVPVAGIVFLASILVPLMKIFALSWLHATQGSNKHRHARMAIHGFLVKIGSWAMIDIFLLSVLAAVGQLGVLAGVEPREGSIFFCALILSTYFSAEVYKPWLIWQESHAKAR
jgi:paraquat-inducible protein A